MYKTITIKSIHRNPKIFYYDTHKVIKKLFFLVYIKVDQENIMFFENDHKSYTMVNLYLNDRFLVY